MYKTHYISLMLLILDHIACTQLRPIATDVTRSMVCLSVCQRWAYDCVVQ